MELLDFPKPSIRRQGSHTFGHFVYDMETQSDSQLTFVLSSQLE